MRPIILLIAGGHAAGKKLAADLLQEGLDSRFDEINIVKIDMSCFTKEEAKEALESGSRAPQCFDFDQLVSRIKSLGEDESVDLVIVYGLYALYNQELVDFGTVRIFIDTDADVRLGRWIKRDVLGPTKRDPSLKSQQARKLKQLLHTYLDQSKGEMKDYVEPTKEKADIILPSAAEMGGIRLIIDGIDPMLRRKLGIGSGVDEDASKSRERQPIKSVRESLRVPEPSVVSLGAENFKSQNGRFFEMN